VGCDRAAEQWLQSLEKGLLDKGACFQCVYHITYSSVAGKTFEEYVQDRCPIHCQRYEATSPEPTSP
jgi:hypothetical protein